MNMLVKTEVVISGTDSGDVTIIHLHSLVVRLTAFGIGSYELHVDETVIEGEKPDFMKKSAKLIGKKTTVKVTVPNESPRVIFKGIVTNVSCNNTAEQSSIVIKAETPEVLMNYGLKKKVFNEMTVKDIAQKISSSYPTSHLSFDNNGFGLATSVKTTFIQYNETDYQFLQRLADSTGNWFFNDGEKTRFGKALNEPAVELRAGDNMTYFDINARAGGIQHEAELFNPADDQMVSSKSSSVSADSLTNTVMNETKNTFSNKESYHVPKYLEDANKLGKYLEVRYHQQVAEVNTISGTTTESKLKLGGVVKVKRGDVTVGEYRVISLDIVVSAEGNYSNHFVGSAFSDYAPRRLQPPSNVPSEMLGRVVAVNDPDGFGKVKVRLDWQASNEEYGWLSVVSPSASNDAGLYMRPEVNSWVIVHVGSTIGLWDSCVIGAMYTGRTKPQRWKDKDNHIKGIKTEKGNEILLEDKGNDGKAISIQTSDDDKNYMWLVDNNGNTEIYLRSKSIKLMAENDLEISAGGKLILQGTDVKISSGTTTVSKDSASQSSPMALIELKSAGDAVIDSKTHVEVKAIKEIKLTSTANFTATANAVMQLSGKASTTLKSDAILTVQGTLVKIN